MRDQDNYTRAIAGLTLKNNLLKNFNKTPLFVLDYVKSVCLQSLDSPDPDTTIRRTIGSVMTSITVRGQILNWPEAMQALVGILEKSTDPLAIDTALDTLQKICEDNAPDLNEAVFDTTPILDYIIPQITAFIDHKNERFRVLAVSALSHFIQLRSPSLLAHMDQYLQSLFRIASDNSTQVRQEVCRSFVMLLDHFTENLLPYLSSLIEYMIFCHQSEDSKVALEACDFWHQFARLEKIRAYLTPYLLRVIPVILSSLVYTDQDLIMFGNEEDEEENSSPQDLQLRFGNSYIKINGRHYRHYREEDEDEEDPEDEEFFSEWTLRKFSATSLDALTSAFTSQVTNILLPLLNNTWFSDDWRIVESGILALGAAAEGGFDSIAPHLPELIPLLISNMSNPNAHVRYIACWTLSRFSSWIVAQCDDLNEGRTRFYEPVLRELLRRILDKNKRVQEAACSAFSTLEEHASSEELVPYLPVILNHLTRALRLYKNRNLRLLYDTIGTLAESVGSSLNEPACIAVLMPPLISRWNHLEDTDSNLFPLLGCLTDIATSLGVGFLPFTEPVFTRCVMLVSTTLQNAIQDPSYDDFDDDMDDEFIVVPLDLLSGIVQGLGNTVEPFVKKSTLLPLLAVCSHYDSRYEVLQPTYALIGDLAKACFTTLDPYLENIMPELIRQLKNDDMSYKSVRNNAIWAIGEIAIRWRKENMEKYVESILQTLIPLIHSQTYTELHENAVNTIGRLGIHNAEMIASALPLFARNWLYLSRNIRENEEKDSAFQGF
ncbi:Transportin-1, partial [Rhizopus stolonifer]